MTDTLRTRFLDCLERHVSKLTTRGSKATGLCPFHREEHPSFSANLEKCVWHCFGCGAGGSVKHFALLVGETSTSTHSETRVAKARRARFQVEQQARAILAQWAEGRDKQLCAAHREAHAEAVAAADLLALFHRRPDLAAEFPVLLARTEKEYGQALFQTSILAARLDGEN